MKDVVLPGWASTLGKVSGYLIVLLVIYVMFLPFIASKSPYPSGTASHAVRVSKQTYYLPWGEYVGFILVGISTFVSTFLYAALYVSARFRQRGGVGS